MDQSWNYIILIIQHHSKECTQIYILQKAACTVFTAGICKILSDSLTMLFLLFFYYLNARQYYYWIQNPECFCSKGTLNSPAWWMYLLWTQGKIHMDNAMWEEISFFFRKAEDFPKIYEAFPFVIRCDKSWVTSGKTFHEINQSCPIQHCTGNCGVYRTMKFHGLHH